ncbi:hypothetical protein NEMIN01_0166 [Nematocida minor]|uniref:uncharacterized protein n=1 Tax=Nematocida minor TaxID=1912983 RepID=UPI00221E732A|nr:uncharacterized protein NEMIN01_0062 [Nematocida minor]XP_051332068.1 uncharacterized protein NEMIN01_0166 [Nematocida minor]KAI5188798.1 hypothetical protein NEMIN01_0062 [Nematocida minor]KAI5188902.1 hypothetical protein NEMIN01_0166 [Nematocida minor]
MSCITDCNSCPSKGACAIKNEGEGPSKIEKSFMDKIVIGVMSGKGGVGKSTVSASLALQLSAERKTCIIDADIAGPSIARVAGVDSSQIIAETHIPSKVDSLYVFTPEKKSGPTKGVEILQYLEKISIEEYDVIVIDTPPGTSDVHIALAKHIPNIKIVLVTTPHKLSIADTNRQISFCNKSGLEIAAVVENMSGYKCASCEHVVPPQKTAHLTNLRADLPCISIPMSQMIAKESDSGVIQELKKYMNMAELKIFK